MHTVTDELNYPREWMGNIDKIPKGYILCDGENGTPDLTNRVLVDGNLVKVSSSINPKMNLPPYAKLFWIQKT